MNCFVPSYLRTSASHRAQHRAEGLSYPVLHSLGWGRYVSQGAAEESRDSNVMPPSLSQGQADFASEAREKHGKCGMVIKQHLYVYCGAQRNAFHTAPPLLSSFFFFSSPDFCSENNGLNIQKEGTGRLQSELNSKKTKKLISINQSPGRTMAYKDSTCVLLLHWNKWAKGQNTDFYSDLI